MTEDRRRRTELKKLRSAGRVVWGKFSYGAPAIETFAFDETRLIVGSYCSIAKNVTFILGGNHPTDRATTFPLRIRLGVGGAGTDGFPSSKGDIQVGNDVWIAHGATILSGARIGDGAVVAAGAIVSGVVPPYSIVAGVPARVQRARVDPDLAQRMQSVRWWEWPDAKVREHADLLSEPLTDEVVRALELIAGEIEAARE